MGGELAASAGRSDKDRKGKGESRLHSLPSLHVRGQKETLDSENKK